MACGAVVLFDLEEAVNPSCLTSILRANVYEASIAGLSKLIREDLPVI